MVSVAKIAKSLLNCKNFVNNLKDTYVFFIFLLSESDKNRSITAQPTPFVGEGLAC